MICLGAVAADQCHRRAQSGVRRRHVGDVDHQHVHADGADDRNAPPARPAPGRRGRAADSRRRIRAAAWRRATAARPATGPRSSPVVPTAMSWIAMMRVDSRNAGSRSGHRDVTGRHRAEQRQPGPDRRQPRAREPDGRRAVGGVVREVREPLPPRLLHADVELVQRLLASRSRPADRPTRGACRGPPAAAPASRRTARARAAARRPPRRAGSCRCRPSRARRCAARAAPPPRRSAPDRRRRRRPASGAGR